MSASLSESDDASLTRFARHLPKGRDVTLIVLKGHLLVEEEVNKLLQLLVKNPQHLPKARLSFAQRLRLIQALYPERGASDALILAIERLNTLRNELAHQLEPKHITSSICQFNRDAMATVTVGGRVALSSSYTIREIKMSIAVLYGRLEWLQRVVEERLRGNVAT